MHMCPTAVQWGKHRGRPTEALCNRTQTTNVQDDPHLGLEGNRMIPLRAFDEVAYLHLHCIAHTPKRMSENGSRNAYLLVRQWHHTVQWTKLFAEQAKNVLVPHVYTP